MSATANTQKRHFIFSKGWRAEYVGTYHWSGRHLVLGERMCAQFTVRGCGSFLSQSALTLALRRRKLWLNVALIFIKRQHVLPRHLFNTAAFAKRASRALDVHPEWVFWPPLPKPLYSNPQTPFSQAQAILFGDAS